MTEKGRVITIQKTDYIPEEILKTEEILHKVANSAKVDIILDPSGTFDVIAWAHGRASIICEFKRTRQRGKRSPQFTIGEAEVGACRLMDVPVIVWVVNLDKFLWIHPTGIYPTKPTPELLDSTEKREIAITFKHYKEEKIREGFAVWMDEQEVIDMLINLIGEKTRYET